MALYANQSCKKEDNDDIILSETIEVTIGQKESFSYTLPNSNNNKLFTVRDQSNNFAVTSINTDNTASTFVYTPSENFTGTDLVVLSNENNQRTNNGKGCQHHHERSSGNEHKNNKSKDHQDDDDAKHTITFKITVSDKK